VSVVLRNVQWYDWRQGTLAAGDLLVGDDPGADPQLLKGEAPADAAVADGGGGLAMAGLVCGHHHLYSALARGMPAPPRAPRNFVEILELIWWRLDRCLDLEMVRASALAGAMDMLRSGVTAVVDHHSSPNAVTGSLDALAQGLDAAGLAHVLCVELSDRDGPAAAEAGLAETDRWLASGHPGLVGLHASFTVGDPLLQRAVDLARKHDVGVHVHVAEDRADQEHCRATYGCGLAERFARAGALALPGTILGHGLWLDDADRDLVRRAGAWLAVNVESNQNNAVGAFRAAGFDPARILLGTDGMHGDLLRSLQAAFLSGSADGGLEGAQAWQALWNNRRWLEAHAPAAARRNDVVLLRNDAPTPLAADNILGHALYGLDARQVRTVIAGGRLVLVDGRLTLLDEDDTLRFCREQARRLWERLGARGQDGAQP